tara:strand:- start:146 stop:412 length:267 start_codon:yes stop_codon:yes gene_type:complete
VKHTVLIPLLINIGLGEKIEDGATSVTSDPLLPLQRIGGCRKKLLIPIKHIDLDGNNVVNPKLKSKIGGATRPLSCILHLVYTKNSEV